MRWRQRWRLPQRPAWDADQDLVGECRGLVLAMVAAYRWRRDDQHPSGRQSAADLLHVLRDGPPWPAVA